ncbi:DNA helicase I [Schizosaccharomyces japonicus yFS275]|uniref:DNA 3'-5' helicase n=1 Tax=Schizosaccharomyces japonicus (strain yFS275 / FY16936) TaxID=402676 RepID=B6K198_SCHJY|nr:DNA helicase I [Schizosaccharomyces japonicus yFS275]EEB07719.1 DNA helicase I [Schizosaccharomyces japonicus yFS275]
MTVYGSHKNGLDRLPVEVVALICRFLSVPDISNLLVVFPQYESALQKTSTLFWKRKAFQIVNRQKKLAKEALTNSSSPESSASGFVLSTQFTNNQIEREYYSKADELKALCGLEPNPLKVQDIATALNYLTSRVTQKGKGKVSFFQIPDVNDEWLTSVQKQLVSFFSPAAVEAFKSLHASNATVLFLQAILIGMLFEDQIWYYFNFFYDVCSTTSIEFMYYFQAMLTIVSTDCEHFREPLTQTLVSTMTRVSEVITSIENITFKDFSVGLTQEQQDIVNCELNAGEILKVKAFAGTGKTRALYEFAKKRPNDKLLYVAFNKAAKEEAESRFPHNVKCSTMHGLAYGAILANINLPASKLERRLSNSTIAELLSLHALFPKKAKSDSGERPTATLVASHIMYTLNHYMHSTDTQLGYQHISKRSLDATQLSKKQMLMYTAQLWAMITNFNNMQAPLIPDAYMKLMHLYDIPNVLTKYDYILFDEAQDFTRCMVDVIYRQKHARIVIVGDAHQCIYGFRGADACAFNETLYPSTKQLYLTKSFRFGNSVAAMANFVLSLKGERVKLCGAQQDTVYRMAYAGINMDPNNERQRFIPHTIIFRTNKELILHSLRLAVALPKNIPIVILGSMKKKAFQLLRSGADLAHGRRPTYPKLREFPTWNAFETHIKKSAEEDPELSLVYDLAEELFSDEFVNKLECCEQRLNTSSDDDNNGVILTTAHQAKGLEWENVQLGDDFRPKFDSISYTRIPYSRFLQEEINILYVALTRAKKNLILNPMLTKYYALLKGLARYAGGLVKEKNDEVKDLEPVFLDWQIRENSFTHEPIPDGGNFFVNFKEYPVWDLFFGKTTGPWQNYIVSANERLKRSMALIEELFN